MEKKVSYKIETILVMIYLAGLPLFYKQDPNEFHSLKLLVLYLVIGAIFLVSMFVNKDFYDKFKQAFRTYKLERKLFFIAVLFMFMSLFNNLLRMNYYAENSNIQMSVFYGAKPTYLSIFFYWGCMLLFLSLVPVWHYVKKSWVKYATIASLVIVGLLIVYQVFVNDFIGVARSYLFGFGNSNYTPDPFALVGLMLVLPFLFSEKINWTEFGIGVFMFIVVLLSLSRAAFVGLGASVLVTLIFLAVIKKLEWKRTLILAVAGIATLAAAVFILSAVGDTGIMGDFKSLFSLLSGDSDFAGVSSFRVDIWTSTIQKMIEEPIIFILGYGQTVYIWQADATTYLVTNVHNMYLDILFSGGVFVFAIFMFLLVKQYMYAIRLAKFDVKNVVLLSGLVFVSVKWMFNSLNAIHSPFIIMLFILISYRYMELKGSEEE